MADVQVALPVATLTQEALHPEPASVIAFPNAVIVVESAQDGVGPPVSTVEGVATTAERPPALAEADVRPINPPQDENDSIPAETTESAQDLDQLQSMVPVNEIGEAAPVEASAEPAVVQGAPSVPPDGPSPGVEGIQVDSTVQEIEATESSGEPAEPIVVPDFEVDITESFPFTEEEEIDLGAVFTGQFIVYEPQSENNFPFDTVDDADLPEVIKGNFASFFKFVICQEFYRNYIRGNSIRRLRTAPDAVKGKPSALQGIFRLPLEVLYDVLELAHPMDLLHLARSTKALRAIVMSKKAEHVWKNAYENHDDIYANPEEISPPKWTSMVYDDSFCDFCGEAGALLDFALEEHYCENCQRKYLVEQNDMVPVTDNYPRLLPLLYQVLVPTYRQSGGKYLTYYESFNNARYRRSDVEAMIETLQTWYMTIDEGMIPEAGEIFDAWSQELINKCSRISEYAQAYNNWATTFYYTICTELSSRQKSVAEQCMKKFAKLGYDERDTEAASSDLYYYFRGAEVWRLTPRVMEKHKEEIIFKIETHKRERLRRERREFVDNFYKEYRKTLKPAQWEHLPPQDVVSNDDVFLLYINQESLENIEEFKVDVATARLPNVIEEWLFNRQKELYEVLPGVTPGQEETYVAPTEEELTPEELEKRTKQFRLEKRAELKITMEERMKRATAIFSCSSCKHGRHAGQAVVGWRAACTHMCGSYPHFFHSSWEFSSVGYAAAASLVRQLGLDPDVATSDEVDAVDARFFCGNCPVKTHKKIQGRKAYTWRECVAHAVEKEEDHAHAIPAWLLLSKQATVFVRAHETQHPSPRKVNWSCNHCAEHIDGGVTLKAAAAHVKESHSIENPVVDTDVIFLKGRYERGRNSRRRPIFHYGIEPTCNLRCNLCRSGRVQRMWTIQTLVPHLFHMHGISMPQSVRDYSKMEVLST